MCHVGCSQIFIASYLFFTNFECDHRLWLPKVFYCHPNMLPIKFAMSKKNGCMIFLNSLGILAKCPILSFPRLQTVQLFKIQKKNRVHTAHVSCPPSTHIYNRPNRPETSAIGSIKKFETLHDHIINS
jgi:hypothetical protein